MFDREAYSLEFFAEMKQRRIAILTYHKHPGQDWPVKCDMKVRNRRFPFFAALIRAYLIR